MDQNVEKILEIKNRKMQKAFNQNHIELLFLNNQEELLKYLDNLIEENQTVGVGGSMTLFETGVIDYLRKKPIRFLDRYQEGLSTDQIENIFHQSLLADVYLTSSNAIDRNGNLYNIDGRGNRVAAMIYGPKKVVVIVGMNKIFDDELSAIQHIKNMSCPANALRLHKNTPCVQVGKCVDCQSDDRICSAYVKIARQPLGRMTVLVINEELGY
ncbi:MAG: lactate utilization protein [Faecalibacillus sp.]|uniref:lactate utilization protein n=1 Tax=Faecalibacillus sp. TaxID=2678891 RepID=UPI00399A4EB8